MHEIDASFRKLKQTSLAHRRKRRWRKAAFAAVALFFVALAAGYYFTADQWSIRYYEDEVVAIPEGEEMLPEDAAVYVPAIVDLPGDPMTISLGVDTGEAPKVRSVPKPPDLAAPGIAPRIEILSDAMVSTSQRFMTTIPSSQEDFAFFQTQRQVRMTPGAPAAQGGEGASAASPQTQDAAFDAAAGWGETIGEGEAALPEFKKTEIENTTSIAFVRPEAERFNVSEDIFVKVLTERTLESLALENGFGEEDARAAEEALKSQFETGALEPGFVVALRGLRAGKGGPMTLMQVSVYADETYVGTLARAGEGRYVPGTDPWVYDDLFDYSGEVEEAGPQRQYRLLDAIYSTAARNQVPTGIIGEAIMYLSRGHDLNAFAAPDDRFVLVYSRTARDETASAGRVLYIAVESAEKSFECFVFRREGEDFGCMSEGEGAPSMSLVGGMVTPVNGVMTSTFGPRRHPILKTVRIHKGVDWSAPVGTPVLAAFDGEIAFQGDGGGYGNLVRVAHEGGRETRYAHLDRFAPGREEGAPVKAGDLIGYVGTTGLSTGPHLHFELYEGEEAVNPMVTQAAASDDSAVAALTNRIIQVESAGNVRAKNPLSSATGLGQFIDSTWIRMMRTYRPELAASLPRAELLALRFDPTVSREMVRNLAREGEAYLRARGHQITAGRLYLCHFLGMEGAATVLSAPAGAPLIQVLGPSVIGANPFLTGKDVSWIQNWAERKMRSSGTRVAAAPQAPPVPPEFLRYRQTISQLVQSAVEVL